VKKISLIMALSVVLVFGLALQAAAYSSFYDFRYGHDIWFPGNAAPYVVLKIDLDTPTRAIATFKSQAYVHGVTNLMGGNDAVALNVNAASFTFAASGSNAGTGFTPGPFTPSAPGNVDIFGTFNCRVDDFDGFTHAVDTLVVVLNNLSGTWASAADVIKYNSDHWYAAAHIFDTYYLADTANGYYAEGFVAAYPIPPTVLLLASGLLGLAGWRRLKKG
jgi:hypothetical protein